MKKHLIYDIYGNIVVYSANNIHFASLEDVKRFLEVNKNFSLSDIKTNYWSLGIPDFINIEESIKNDGKIVYYSLDELQLIPDENYNP